MDEEEKGSRKHSKDNSKKAELVSSSAEQKSITIIPMERVDEEKKPSDSTATHKTEVARDHKTEPEDKSISTSVPDTQLASTETKPPAAIAENKPAVTAAAVTVAAVQPTAAPSSEDVKKPDGVDKPPSEPTAGSSKCEDVKKEDVLVAPVPEKSKWERESSDSEMRSTPLLSR